MYDIRQVKDCVPPVASGLMMERVLRAVGSQFDIVPSASSQ